MRCKLRNNNPPKPYILTPIVAGCHFIMVLFMGRWLQLDGHGLCYFIALMWGPFALFYVPYSVYIYFDIHKGYLYIDAGAVIVAKCGILNKEYQMCDIKKMVIYTHTRSSRCGPNCFGDIVEIYDKTYFWRLF